MKMNKQTLVFLLYLIVIILIVCNIVSVNNNYNFKRQTYFQFKKHVAKQNITTDSFIHVAVIIPFRNRKLQLATFIDHMCDFWGLQDTVLNIYVINQISIESFKRAWLFNVGLKLISEESQVSTCVVLHDVDLLPLDCVNYKTCDRPRHLSSEAENFDWGVPYNSFSGGVFSASFEDWRKINGMSNLFSGWGGEDDEMFERWKRINMTKSNDTPYRSEKGCGKFKKNTVNHYRDTIKENEYSANVNFIHDLRNGKRNSTNDGLNQVKFTYFLKNKTTLQNCAVRVTKFDVDN